MEIVNFFEKLAGRWFSQRTTHALSTQQSKAGKSDLEVAYLPSDSADVQQLCQEHAVQKSPLCGLRVQQSSTVDGDTNPKVMSTLLVPLVPEDSDAAILGGTLIRSGSKTKSCYALEDEVLTIASEEDGVRSTERMWFINDNLRMRTGITELPEGLRIASFCSEIRMGVKPPKQD